MKLKGELLALLSSSLCVLCVLCGELSGLQRGQRPGPYTFVLSTGPQRGKLHCYICETEDRPGVIVFARTLSDPLGKLVAELDKAVRQHEKLELRAWVTFLSDDQPALDAKIVTWGQKFAIRSVPLGVFEDAAGPPSYRLVRNADLTVLFFVKQKVVANYTFKAGELTDAKAGEVMKALPRILHSKK